MEVSGQLKVPGALSPVKQPQVPIEYETGWAAALVWSISKKRKISGAVYREWSALDISVY